VPDIAAQLVEPAQTPLISHRFHGRSHGAGTKNMSLSLRRKLEVRAQFLLEIGIRPPWAEDSPEAKQPLAERSHVALASA
jgi:hypothetical protein